MQRFVAGTCTMHLTITLRGPWIVRGQTKPETFVDQRRQQSQRDILFPLLDAQRRPLLPASSLKGVLRSTAERILRSVDPERSARRTPLADEPFVHQPNELSKLQRGQIADSELVEWNKEQRHYSAEELKPQVVYKIQSAASQLFGSTLHAGLLRLEDATAASPQRQRRSHVAIDRFTGGVGEGPFIEELAPAATTLETKLTLSNFALWQIGLLALVFQEINRGYVGLGGGTRKGQGQAQIAVPQITIQYPEIAYNVTAGVISAQARLADPPWSLPDIPEAVLAVERGRVLLADLEPYSARNWRESGTQTLVIQEEQITPLFTEAVGTAWRAWVDEMTRDEHR
jgi:CRISPR/Cas system CSM-associated protein Csm3 (group 7 of RAMP superfamily)